MVFFGWGGGGVYRSVLSGVKYLHEHDIVHRDLKCVSPVLSSSLILANTDIWSAVSGQRTYSTGRETKTLIS